ncbi:serine/threonine-protein kinase [Amycolatopsis nigrescens]|uniref:serine/threonine-protein kinase n=1 Tax=Amycolatopsis nigrescens TaxID=381445 RepID=UPI0004758491|nr:serine/threonine-protein kinase [Amycolatopsis nigrescens]
MRQSQYAAQFSRAREGAAAETNQLIADRYQLLEEIGSGGMGVVWRSFDHRLSRMVALKQAKLPDSASSQKLLREAKLAAGLQHPNVVTVHDAFVEGDGLWLVMEWVPAFSLAEMLVHGSLPVPTVIEIGRQLADALEAVHRQGIVHRDIKPGNVLITALGAVKLTDFGISRSVLTDETITQAPVVGGVPGYIAPEVADGVEPTRAADVFALGATLYAAVEGKPPFAGANPYAVLRKTVAGAVTPPQCAGELEPVLATLMRMDPQERPKASEVRPLLTACRNGTSTDDLPARPAPTGARRSGRTPRWNSFRWTTRRRVQAGAAVTVVVLIAVVVSVVNFDGVDGVSTSPPAASALSARVGVGGDVRAVDPCPLLDLARLKEYGEATLDSDYGGFSRCDVVVERPGGKEIDVKVELFDPPGSGFPPEGDVVRVGPFEVSRDSYKGGECGRLIHLHDGYRVDVVARWESDPDQSDLCAIADTATQVAVGVLSASGMPRRTTRANSASLARLDACTLLDAGALATVAKLDTPQVDPAFANWDCEWEDSASSTTVRVRFDHASPPDGRDGKQVRIGDREAYVGVNEYESDSCQVKMVHRFYTDPRGSRSAETVLVLMSGPLPSDQYCAPVTTLADAVVKKIPKA